MAPAVIVCTLNRARELRACLGSVASQDLVPACVIVVDASDADVFDVNERMMHQLAERSGIEMQHLRSQRGLAVQRNAGVDAVRSRDVEWVQFLDDDVELLPGYLAQVNCGFEEPLVVGVEGADHNQRATPRWIFRILYPRLGRGSCLSKTGHNWFPRAKAACNVDWLSGCAPAYRRNLLGELRFDERRTGNGYGEDVDFSFRVGSRGRVLYDPSAGYVHRPSSRNRAFGAELGLDVVAHRQTLSHDFKASFGPTWVRYGFLVEAIWTLVGAAVHRNTERAHYARVLLQASYRRRQHVLDRVMS